MDLDQPRPVEHLDQLSIGADLDPGPDQVAGDRVQRLGHLDVVITVDLGVDVDRQVIGRCRRWPQPGLFLEGEQFGRATLGRAVDSHPSAFPTPPLGVALPVGQIDEVLAREHRAPGELNDPLDSGLGPTRRLRLISRLDNNGCG